MSGTDVTDGEGEEVARGDSADDAVWLELIGRFDAPADSTDSTPPWPERENLPPSGSAGPGEPGERPAADEARKRAAGSPDGPDSGHGHAAADEATRSETAGGKGLGSKGPTSNGPAGEAADGAAAGSEGPGAEGPVGLEPARPWPDRENLPPPPPRSSDLESWTGGRPSRPVYHQFELPAPPADPRSWTAPDDEDEGHYTPPPPPPLPSMSPVTKGAWVALFGGPAYLLTATLASWSVAGWALFLAIAAFVGGFTVLALRLGDRPDDGSGPDDGAVV